MAHNPTVMLTGCTPSLDSYQVLWGPSEHWLYRDRTSSEIGGGVVEAIHGDLVAEEACGVGGEGPR